GLFKYPKRTKTTLLTVSHRCQDFYNADGSRLNLESSVIIKRYRFLNLSGVAIIRRCERELDAIHQYPFIHPAVMLGVAVAKAKVATPAVPGAGDIPIPDPIFKRINPDGPVIDAVFPFIQENRSFGGSRIKDLTEL